MTFFDVQEAANANTACTAMYKPGTLNVSNMISAVSSLFSGVFKGGSMIELNRMFELNLSKGAEQPQGAAPRTLAESAEVLAAPRMYYEIQRGVKKLRF